MLLVGHYAMMSSRYQLALDQYLRAYAIVPQSPLTSLFIGKQRRAHAHTSTHAHMFCTHSNAHTESPGDDVSRDISSRWTSTCAPMPLCLFRRSRVSLLIIRSVIFTHMNIHTHAYTEPPGSGITSRVGPVLARLCASVAARSRTHARTRSRKFVQSNTHVRAYFRKKAKTKKHKIRECMCFSCASFD